jgi:hypothetical protein
MIWKHRNECVFDRANPSVQSAWQDQGWGQAVGYRWGQGPKGCMANNLYTDMSSSLFLARSWPLRRLVNLNSTFPMQWNAIVYCVFSKNICKQDNENNLCDLSCGDGAEKGDSRTSANICKQDDERNILQVSISVFPA